MKEVKTISWKQLNKGDVFWFLPDPKEGDNGHLFGEIDTNERDMMFICDEVYIEDNEVLVNGGHYLYIGDGVEVILIDNVYQIGLRVDIQFLTSFKEDRIN